MIFNHLVKHDGTYYPPGTDVPIEDEKGGDKTPPISDNESQHKYTYAELADMTVKSIRALAEDLDVEITKTLKEDIINEFLEGQK